MYVKLNGEMVYPWRAVNHEGEALETYVTKTRDKGGGAGLHKEGYEAPRCTRDDHDGRPAQLRCRHG